jgi:ribosomal protein S12 methylthiotransferase
MQRRVDRAATEELLARLRASIPTLTLRTTFIVGFPGETEQEFSELFEFCKAQAFDRLGVFPYSREPGTPADRLPEQVSEEVKTERRDRLMAMQQTIAFVKANQRVGTESEVIVDSPDPEIPGYYSARGPFDAPEIDCNVRLKGKNLRPGDLVRVRITGSDGYDLAARAIRVR